jgi:hypothetical protein
MVAFGLADYNGRLFALDRPLLIWEFCWRTKGITMNTKRFSMIKKVLCMVAFAMSISSPAFAVPIIDGNVLGFAEGYTSHFDVSFNIENGPTGVPGGSLFRAETSDTMFFGLILPQNIVDNTYGDTKALDWGSIDHFLIGGGGGKSLEGSDKLGI